MNIPMSWLKDYIDIDCSIKEYCDAMTMSGSKVEGYESLAKELSGVVVGKILKIDTHPNADKLVVTTVDIGKEKLQIVTGAKNIYEGAIVPVATNGAVLANNVIIRNGLLRDVESNGMLCSVEEMGADRHDFPEAPEHGIYIFNHDAQIGSDAIEVMDLKDDVIEFEITSNRSDCFSLIGLARESAATFKKQFKMPDIEIREDAIGDINSMVSVRIENPVLCPRYIARVIKNVKIESSPRWMRKRLRAAGIRPINNIVDITNYVMVELGHPMHAFSINTIEDGKIIIRNAKKDEEITTLDGTKRTLDSSMLVIADPKKAVAIAGVMGGENSKINDDSSTILFESANFDGPNVRITAKKLGLRTDASSKYEKGIDPNLSRFAIDRAVQLVEILGAGEVVKGCVDNYPNKREPWDVSYSEDEINRLLGTNISEEEMIEYLERIDIIINKEKKLATIPTFRPDIISQPDLAEEVARFYGYDNIVSTLASGTPTAGRRSYSQSITDIIKKEMVSNGLCESMSYTFESPKVFDKLNIDETSDLRKNIVISNPLGEDFSVMRTTTLNGILNSLSINYNRRNEKAALFEMGKIYIPKQVPITELPSEKNMLTMGMYGDVDFYKLKGMLENLFTALGMDEAVEYMPECDINWMHPGRTANITVNGLNFGYMGEVHPEILDNYDIGARVYLAVIDTDMIIENANLVRKYKALPKYPAIIRDISMVVKDTTTVKEIEDIIKENSGDLLEKIALFDVYKGTQIEEGNKSVSYSITFRAEDRTLVDEEVKEIMNKVISALEIKLKAILRDK